MIEHLADKVGFGLVKAGFVIQLVYGLCGCLDTHNLRKYGVKKNSFNKFKTRKTIAGRRTFIARYVTLCYQLGGPSVLWDKWCEYVAERQPTRYDDAEHVSRLHCECLNLT